MSTEFDPYHKWLGIPPANQPANHYQLLGIAEFETDREVIGAAADRQMAHLRTKSSGAHGDLSQKLLNEVAQAKVVLLNDDKREAYNQTLKGPPIAPPAISDAPPAPPQQMPEIGDATPSITPEINTQSGGGIQIDAAKNKPHANKARTGPRSGSRKNILIIQNTIAIGLAIVALISLWLLYPVIAGNGDGNDNDNQNAKNTNDDKPKNDGGNKNGTTNGQGNRDQNNKTDNGKTNQQQNTGNGTKQKAKIFVDLRATKGEVISVVANHQQLSVSNDGHYTLEVDPGNVRVALKRDGFETVSQQFDLKPGQTDSWSPRWKPSSSIVINSDGDDIDVTIDDASIMPSDIKDRADGSKQIFVVPGEHDVQIKRDGHEDISQALTLRDKEDLFLEINWTKKTSALDNVTNGNASSGTSDRDQNYASFTQHWPSDLSEYGNAPRGATESNKLKLPDSSDIKSATAQLNETLPDFRTLKSIQQMSVLANKCQQARVETDPLAKYCWLDICREMAEQIAQPALAAWMVDHINHWYQLEPRRYRRMRIDAINEASKKSVDPQLVSETLNLVGKMVADIQYRDQLGDLLNLTRRMRGQARRHRVDIVTRDADDDLGFLTMANWIVDQDAADENQTGLTWLFAIKSFQNAVIYQQWDVFIDEFTKWSFEGQTDDIQKRMIAIVKRVEQTQFENKAHIELADLFWELSQSQQEQEASDAFKAAARYWYLHSAKAVPVERFDQVNRRLVEYPSSLELPGNQPAMWVELFGEQGWRRANELNGQVSVVDGVVQFNGQSSATFGKFDVPAFVLQFDAEFTDANSKLVVMLGGRRYRRIELQPVPDQSQLNIVVKGNDGMSEIAEVTKSCSWDPGAKISFYVRPGEIDLCVNHQLAHSIDFVSEPVTLRLGSMGQSSVTLNAMVVRQWSKFDQAYTGLTAPKFRHDGDIAKAAFQHYRRVDMNSRDNRRTWTRRNIGLIHMPLHPMVTNRPLEYEDGQGQPQLVNMQDNFWISEREITQRQWNAVMETNPSISTGSPYLPIDQVSYIEAAEFCKRLTLAAAKVNGLQEGMVYRLPTEAEWQYACRFGFRERPNAGPAMARSDRSFWSKETSGGAMQQIGSYTEIDRRVHDMQGNVSEWVMDAWSDRQDWSGGNNNPFVLPRAADDWIVVRGGAFWNNSAECFEDNRVWREPVGAVGRGFRIVLAKPVTN